MAGKPAKKPAKAKAPADRKERAKTGQFGKGNPGRPRGAVNKVTADVKAMIHQALIGAGGAKYLQKQANENPAAFMSLVGRTLPKELTGAGGADLIPTKITIELVAAK